MHRWRDERSLDHLNSNHGSWQQAALVGDGASSLCSWLPCCVQELWTSLGPFPSCKWAAIINIFPPFVLLCTRMSRLCWLCKVNNIQIVPQPQEQIGKRKVNYRKILVCCEKSVIFFRATRLRSVSQYDSAVCRKRRKLTGLTCSVSKWNGPQSSQ